MRVFFGFVFKQVTQHIEVVLAWEEPVIPERPTGQEKDLTDYHKQTRKDDVTDKTASKFSIRVW